VEHKITVDIVTRSEDLPEMACGNFFHSCELFRIAEQTPGQRPYMVIALQESSIVAHMLAMLRRRGSFFPPYIFTQGRVYGEGEYSETVNKEYVFGLMLEAITRKLKNKLCLYIEFSDLGHKMFGYKLFRKHDYYPVHWMEIHNSLHSMPPEERLTERTADRIHKAEINGVTSEVAGCHEDIKTFYRMLRHHITLKIRRYIPDEQQFLELSKTGNCRIIITKFRNKIIGGCACIYSEGNAYLWYLASRRKSYPHLHPATMTVWAAVKYAYLHNFRHIYFMDVGLPFKKNPYREFILSFGGKPVGTYRWFRFSISWINRILSWIYRE